MKTFRKIRQRLMAALLLSALAPAAMATSLPDYDPFYAYDGSLGPLESVPLGTMIHQRTATYRFNGFDTPYTLIQVLYRTTNGLNQPVVNATSILVGAHPNGQAVMDGLAYDATDPLLSPSVSLHNDLDVRGVFIAGLAGGIPGIAKSLKSWKYLDPFKQLVDEGYTVIIPDTEGETADFALGAEEGMTTLDAIRAALTVPASGLNDSSRVAMIGYSGGAIAADWAAQLAPSYAPDVNRRLVGAAFGGLLISPANNVVYINKQLAAGIAPLALAGMARGYAIDPDPYLNNTGLAVFDRVSNDGIADAIAHYLFQDISTWLLPQYQQLWNNYVDYHASLSGVPAIQTLVNNTDAGLQPTPTIPLYFMQGSRGITLGNFTGQPGDGIMLASDARSLVQQFCQSNPMVEYVEPAHNHTQTYIDWQKGALPWIRDRFAGIPAPGNCDWANTLTGSYIGVTN